MLNVWVFRYELFDQVEEVAKALSRFLGGESPPSNGLFPFPRTIEKIRVKDDVNQSTGPIDQLTD